MMASQHFLPTGISRLSRDFFVSVLGRVWREGCKRALVNGQGLGTTPARALAQTVRMMLGASKTPDWS